MVICTHLGFSAEKPWLRYRYQIHRIWDSNLIARRGGRDLRGTQREGGGSLPVQVSAPENLYSALTSEPWLCKQCDTLTRLPTKTPNIPDIFFTLVYTYANIPRYEASSCSALLGIEWYCSTSRKCSQTSKVTRHDWKFNTIHDNFAFMYLWFFTRS